MVGQDGRFMGEGVGRWGYHQVVHCGIAVVAVGVKRTSRYRYGHGIQT